MRQRNAHKKSHDQNEWKLDPNIFAEKVVCPDVDLFASRRNCQIHPVISWGPDPDSAAVDALTVNWSRWAVIYAFPPFSLIQKILGKLENDQAEGLLVVPHWPTAVWYLQMLKLLIRTPNLLPRGKSCSVGPLERSSSSTQTASTSSSLLIRKAVQAQGIHGRTCDICASWREFTKKQYASYLYRWKQFCASRNSDPHSTNHGTCVRVSDKTAG